MLLMWAPGADEMLVIVGLAGMFLAPLILILFLLFRLLSKNRGKAADETVVRDLQQKVAELERRVNEKE